MDKNVIDHLPVPYKKLLSMAEKIGIDILRPDGKQPNSTKKEG